MSEIKHSHIGKHFLPAGNVGGFNLRLNFVNSSPHQLVLQISYISVNKESVFFRYGNFAVIKQIFHNITAVFKNITFLTGVHLGFPKGEHLNITFCHHRHFLLFYYISHVQNSKSAEFMLFYGCGKSVLSL